MTKKNRSPESFCKYNTANTKEYLSLSLRKSKPLSSEIMDDRAPTHENGIGQWMLKYTGRPTSDVIKEFDNGHRHKRRAIK